MLWVFQLKYNCDTEKRKLRHDMLPDVNRAMFEYMVKRIEILEKSIKSGNTSIIDKEDMELEKIYADFIKSI